MKYVLPGILAIVALVTFAVLFSPKDEEPKEELGAKPINWTQVLTAIETEQSKLAKYEQVIDGVSVEGKLSTIELPPGLTVNVYDGPSGKGYQVVYKTDTQVIARGYGPDAEALTYSYQVTASTTP